MINKVLVRERLALIKGYIEQLKQLSSLTRTAFLADKKATGAAESYLRRSLEAIFDVGRHILAKTGATDLSMEYKSIARGLVARDIVDERLGEQLVRMAGYRNRMVHLYHAITDEELYEIVQANLNDILAFVAAVRRFIDSLPSD